eukprot:3534126-Alexandrium_andersonii.AAC.1
MINFLRIAAERPNSPLEDIMLQAASGEDFFALTAAEFPRQCHRLEELATKVLQCDKLHHTIRARANP